jgi:hypothetical protein
MSSAFESAVDSPVISSQEMESLDRLLMSACISKAPRLRTVLKFIIDAYREGRGQEVNEQLIGQQVFGRPVGYNPSEDNIVRVTVRHLRLRLEEYYRTEGYNEPFIVKIPKGKYLLTILPRISGAHEILTSSPALAVEQSSFTEVLEPVISPASALRRHAPSRSWKVPVYCCAGLLLVTVITWLIWPTAKHGSSNHVAEAFSSTILQLLSGHGNRVTIVVADANLQEYRAIYKKQIQLQEYIDRSYTKTADGSSDPKIAGAWQFATGTTETNIASSIVAAELKQASAPEIVDIKHPHDLRMQDFQDENIVLLGGPWINPWGQMFEDKFNFRIVPMDDGPAGSELLNMHPKAGEPSVFTPHESKGVSVDCVRIVFLPNLSGKGRVIILGATSQLSLAGGGNFLADPNSMSTLTSLLHADSPSKLPYFELVLEVRGMENVPQVTKIVAYRTISEGS